MKLSPWGILSCAALVAGVVALAPGRDVLAAIAQQPLTLGGRVKPNVMLVVDNSGSMDGEGLFPTNDGALWWNTGTRSFYGASTGRGGNPGFNFNDAGQANATWKKYIYLFPASDRVYGDGANDHYATPPAPDYAFARSPDYNGQYYNPAVTYAPWPSLGGTTFANASPTAARSNPLAATPVFDLTGNVTQSFRVHPGMRMPNGTRKANNAAADNQDYTYRIASYYRRQVAPAGYSVAGTSYDCATPSPAAYVAWTTGGAATFPSSVQALAPDGYCLSRTEIAAGTPEMQNFANWFQYHRKRHLALRAGMGEAFSGLGGFRTGMTPINNRPENITMYDFDAQRAQVYDAMYGIGGNGGGTPNREALKFAGDQYNRNGAANSATAPIVTHVCQKNFVLQFTDGFSFPDTSNNVGGVDNTRGVPYADAYSNTIADIAMRNYLRIRPDLAGGQVPVPAGCSAANPDPQLDCNRDPHINHYSITLGAQGNIFGVTHDRVADAHANPPAWVNPTAERSPVQVDDLYHASVNGRGEMLNARSSTELTARLSQALGSILNSAGGSGSRTASSSTRAGGGTQLFQARFNSTQWTGELLAFQITAGGSIGTLNWNAATAMPAHGARQIYFAAGTQLRDFEWGNLSAAQQLGLNLDPAAPPLLDNLGERRVRWLRGDVSAQALAGGRKLRDRATALGDIVNSSPRYVGTENYGYDRLPAGAAGRDAYTAFRFAKADRQPMVYVGANDGMLHAFDAATGIEQWAFIPSEFLATSLAAPSPPIAQLPRSDYAHRYYVDGQPVAGDAYFDGGWHTVLVTPMGAGGRSVVAMDITDPAAPELLWEFDPSDDPAIGAVTGQPSIQRMANGRWAAIFGNGYGQNGSAKLFIVDIETGNLVRRIDTDPLVPAGTSNGLSAPYPVDTNGDAVIDMVYAGDLYGNMWRFDVDNPLPAQWAVHHRQGATPKPLITVCAAGNVNGLYACPAASRQPITVRPVVGRGPQAAGQTVYFGTGKFFEDGDNQVSGSGPVQSFYAVFDDNNAQRTPVVGRNALLQQGIVDEVTLANYGTYRVTSNNALGNQPGWFINLVSPVLGFQGERVIADPILQGGRIIFTTLFPGDPCSGGSDGWLMELQARDGSRFDAPILDINGDGLFTVTTGTTQGDTVTNGGQQVAPSGVKSTVGGLQTPTIINIPGQGRQNKIMSGATGNTQEVGERDALPRGRTSWRQLWP